MSPAGSRLCWKHLLNTQWTSNLWLTKNDSNIFQCLVREMGLFLLVQENVPCLFLSLVLFTASTQIRRQQVNGVRRRKRSQIWNSKSSQQNPTIHRPPKATNNSLSSLYYMKSPTLDIQRQAYLCIFISSTSLNTLASPSLFIHTHTYTEGVSKNFISFEMYRMFQENHYHSYNLTNSCSNYLKF